MPLTFPSSPSTNQVYTSGGRSWQWNGTTWAIVPGGLIANSVGTVELANGSVTSAKIASGTWEDDQPVLSSQVFS